MKRSLRALSVVFGSAMLLLGPGQALAGGDWGGGGKGGNKDRDRIHQVRVCLDEHDLDLRVQFKTKGGQRRYENFGVSAFVTGDAKCVSAYDKGWYDDEDIYFKDICTKEEEACRTRGNRLEADLDLEPLAAALCKKGEVLVDLDIRKAEVVINGREFMARNVGNCGDGWEDDYDDDWYDDDDGWH